MSAFHPRLSDLQELVSFLPILHGGGARTIAGGQGVSPDGNGVRPFPWPEYTEGVQRFFRAASKPCWVAQTYFPAVAGAMLEDQTLVSRASLNQVKAMLTHCVRGERFCDGHWAAVIEQGHIRRLLERLQSLAPSLPS